MSNLIEKLNLGKTWPLLFLVSAPIVLALIPKPRKAPAEDKVRFDKCAEISKSADKRDLLDRTQVASGKAWCAGYFKWYYHEEKHASLAVYMEQKVFTFIDTNAARIAALDVEESKVREAKAIASDPKSAPMAVIPAGAVKVKKVGTKKVASFSIDVTEVTVDLYAACVRAGNCSNPRHDNSSCNWGNPNQGNHPVNCVDWNQAKAFCGWAQKRLPTEQEWQLAAESAQGRTYPWGETEPENQLCWNETGNRNSTCAVGSFPSGDSAQGVKDLSGNVMEWTDSSYDTGVGPGRATRGGDWLHNDLRLVRAAFRDGYDPSERDMTIGFRCARSN